jgi:hypothetical protein
LAKEIGKMKFPHNDELFERMIRRTLFSFKTNRRIFRSVLTLHRLRNWRAVMEKVHEQSRWKLTDKDIEDYRGLAIESVTAFLRDPDKAPCTKVDPTGEAKLLYATEIRQELRRLTRKKIVSPEKAEGFLKVVKKALRDTIYKAGDLPNITVLL